MSAPSAAHPNPFYHRGPIDNPAYFFGRARELHQLFYLIQHGQCVSIVGPHRIGKSSLLKQLCHGQVSTSYGLAPNRYTFVYLSGEAWQNQPSNALYRALWSTIYSKVRQELTPHQVLGLSPNLTTNEVDFLTLQQLLHQIQRDDHRLVLLIDEFDTLSRNRYLDEHFFSTLRSLIATLGVIFVTASTQPLLDLTFAAESALNSPFFNIFLPQRMGLLAAADAQALLVGTVGHSNLILSTQQQDQLLELAGPHPFFLQIAGYHYWEALQLNAPAALRAAREAFFAEASAHWLYQWRYLTTEKQRTLALLGVTQAVPAAVLVDLQHTCLIKSSDGRFVPLSPLFIEFIQQQQIFRIIYADPLLIDQQTQAVWLHGKRLLLSPQDYHLLEILAAQPEHSHSYPALAQRLWPEERLAINHQDRLKTAINSLRRKLGEYSHLVVNDPSTGYQFRLSSA